MPTIKEKLADLQAARPNWLCIDSEGLKSENPEWRAWLVKSDEVTQSVAGMALNAAEASVNEVTSRLNKARVEHDKAQKALEEIELELKLAKHTATVLGSVEVP